MELLLTVLDRWLDKLDDDDDDDDDDYDNDDDDDNDDDQLGEVEWSGVQFGAFV